MKAAPPMLHLGKLLVILIHVIPTFVHIDIGKLWTSAMYEIQLRSDDVCHINGYAQK